MSSDRRVVTINPELFKFPSTNKTRKNTASTTDGTKPQIKFKKPEQKQKPTASKTIRKNLLNYIRKHQQDRINEQNKAKQPSREPSNYREEATSDFNDSLEYLMKLTKENESNLGNNQHNKTLRNRPTITNENVSLYFPEEDIRPVIPEPPPMHSPPMYLQPPKYGCLKNGQLPTYRTWKNHTQKNYGGQQQPQPHPQRYYQQPLQQPTPQPPQQTTTETHKDRILREKVEELKRKSLVHPLASSPQHLMQKEQLKHAKKLENNKAPKIYLPKRQKTIRRTYRVGRSKVAPKITVLVSNKTIRKNIYTQSMLFKQKPIREVKQYLIKHGFIRVGSIAPNSLLRQMYETAQLMCGEIKNHNPENLLYNFLHGGGSGGENTQ